MDSSSRKSVKELIGNFQQNINQKNRILKSRHEILTPQKINPTNLMGKEDQGNKQQQQEVVVVRQKPDLVRRQSTLKRTQAFRQSEKVNQSKTVSRSSLLGQQILNDIQKHNSKIQCIERLIKNHVKSIRDIHNDFLETYENAIAEIKSYLRQNITIGSRLKVKIFNLIKVLKEIGDGTKRFLKGIQECDDAYKISETFNRNIPLFELYPKYCELQQNIIVDLKRASNNQDESVFPSLASRIPKYQLFLELTETDLKKYGIQNDELSKVKNKIATIGKQTNDALVIGSIFECPFNLQHCIQFYDKERVKVSRPFKGDCYIYFFRTVIILTAIGNNKYVSHIDVSNLKVSPTGTEQLTLSSVTLMEQQIVVENNDSYIASFVKKLMKIYGSDVLRNSNKSLI